MLKSLSWFILSLIVLLLILSIFVTAPINRNQDLIVQDAHNTVQKYEQLKSSFTHSAGKLKIGWSRSSIMPSFITPMAGYTPRPAYEEVHDSLYIHVLIFDVGGTRVAFLSYDLLIVPPKVSSRVEKLKNDWGIDFVYFSASHTHSGIGGWDSTLGGQAVAGKFDERIVSFILLATQKAINQALLDLHPSMISYITADADNLVKNRLGKQYKVDGRISSLEMLRDDGSRGIFTSYSAHATNVAPKGRMISNDYPGALMHQLEDSGYDFAIFMSGTVGSHSVNFEDDIGDNDPGFLSEYASMLIDAMAKNTEVDSLGDSLQLTFGHLPLTINNSQLRISDNIRIRNGIFNFVFSPLKVDVKYVEIGNIIMLGMPCDFSGEIVVENDLYQYAANKGKHLIITSFNGGYLGYITSDHHYETTKRSEIREMNWVGPYHGAFFTQIVKGIVD